MEIIVLIVMFIIILAVFAVKVGELNRPKNMADFKRKHEQDMKHIEKQIEREMDKRIKKAKGKTWDQLRKEYDKSVMEEGMLEYIFLEELSFFEFETIHDLKKLPPIGSRALAIDHVLIASFQLVNQFEDNDDIRESNISYFLEQWCNDAELSIAGYEPEYRCTYLENWDEIEKKHFYDVYRTYGENIRNYYTKVGLEIAEDWVIRSLIDCLSISKDSEEPENPEYRYQKQKFKHCLCHTIKRSTALNEVQESILTMVDII